MKWLKCWFVAETHTDQNSRLAFMELKQQCTGWSKKSLWCDLEEKCLWNSKIFFDGVFFSIYSHLLKKLELSKLNRKKVIGL